MKNLIWIVILLIVVLACKKNVENSDSNWTFSDQLFTNKIVALQDKAGVYYIEWSKTMDSASVVQKLQKYFLSDPIVESSTIGNQGIFVEYSNGMAGGFFWGIYNSYKKKSMEEYKSQSPPPSENNLKSLVNRKKSIFIDPAYWQFSYWDEYVIQRYRSCLPKVGFSLPIEYLNSDANLECFTNLSGYGIVNFFSHGWPVPSDSNIKDVYLMTGEKANTLSATKYIKDLKLRNIIYGTTSISNSEIATVWWINENFIASHNDFSKDTVLFYGGFCYSLLGNWDQLPSKCAKTKGAFLGFNNAVIAPWCSELAISLIDSLCNTYVELPYSPEKWILGPNPPKSFGNVIINCIGDKDLTLWKDTLRIETRTITDITETSAASGGIIKFDGGCPITNKGVCWSQNTQPKITDGKTSDGAGKGSFTSLITGLDDKTTYYVRAYATNCKGTTYGNELTFKTPNYDLNDYWKADDGHGNKIYGTFGVFYSFNSYWQDVANAGLVTIGSLSMQSIIQIDKLNWTCDILWWEKNNGVYSIIWVPASTINMNNDGLSIIVTSTNPTDPTDIRTKTFYRDTQKSSQIPVKNETYKMRNSGF